MADWRRGAWSTRSRRRRTVAARPSRWLTGLGTLTILVATTLVAGFGQPALAGGPFEPIIGNVTGDEVPDVVMLTEAPGAPLTGDRSAVTAAQVNCEVEVRPGLPGGGLGEPMRYRYLVLPDSQHCPDMGTAANVNGTGMDELMLTWFAGPPPAAPDRMLTIQNFQVIAVTNALYQPSAVGKGDFNGDRLEDIYEWSDQGEGFSTFLSNGNGTFRRGPVAHCGNPLEPPTVRDVDHDAAQDALITYIENCARFSSGVAVLLDDGSVQQLQRDPLGLTTWAAWFADANGDGRPDIRTVHQETRQTQYFINTGAGTFVESPRAVPDHVTVPAGGPATIAVLANDYVGPGATVSIVRQPSSGRAQVTPSGSIIYTPSPSHGRGDNFVYRVSTQGRTSGAGVGITFAAR